MAFFSPPKTAKENLLKSESADSETSPAENEQKRISKARLEDAVHSDAPLLTARHEEFSLYLVVKQH